MDKKGDIKTEVRVIKTLCNGKSKHKAELWNVLDENFFSYPDTIEIFTRLKELLSENKTDVPSLKVLSKDTKLSDKAKVILKNKSKKFAKDSDLETSINILKEYRSKRIIVEGIKESYGLLKEGKPIKKAEMILEKALFRSRSTSSIKRLVHGGIDDPGSYEVFKEILRKDNISLIPTGFKEFDKVVGGYKRGNLVIVTSNTGGGKCFKKDTKVLMYNGSIKNIQDITVKDKVMGIDSKPRTVKNIHTGTSKMYKVVPIKGEPFVCNNKHILSLQLNRGTGRYVKDCIVNISIEDYLNETVTFKHYAKLFRTGVKFKEQKTKLPPYLVGLFLGDGTVKCKRITTPDKEIINYLKKYSKKIGYRLSKTETPKVKSDVYYIAANKRGGDKRKERKNLVTHYLGESIKNKEKFIPKEYLINSRDKRLKLLAGLLDTDGYLHNNFYDITTKYKTLKDDILFLSRSLGFGATWRIKKVIFNNKKLEYYSINITGNVNEIPCKVKRKQAKPRKQIKNVLRTGFKIYPLRKSKYYGFELKEKDGLFILGDFTVVHNSTMALQYLINMYRRKYSVAIISLEMEEDELMERLVANISHVKHSRIRLKKIGSKETIRMKEAFATFEEIGLNYGNRYTFYCPTEDHTLPQLLAQIKHIPYDVIILDYASLVQAELPKETEAKNLGELARKYKRFAVSGNTVNILLAQGKEDGDVKYSRAIKEHANYWLHWNYGKEERIKQWTDINLGKARNAPLFTFPSSMEVKFMKMRDLTPDLKTKLEEEGIEKQMKEEEEEKKKEKIKKSDEFDDF